MTYDEATGGEMPPDYLTALSEGGAGGSIKDKLAYHMEGLIPLILILIIGIFIAWRIGILGAIPGIGPVLVQYFPATEPSDMLIIGASDPLTLDYLNSNEVRRLVKYEVIDVHNLTLRKEFLDKKLANYDIIMLYQLHDPNRALSRQLSESLTDFIGRGGKLLIIKNSGIRISGDVASFGWLATLQGKAPVSCENVYNPDACRIPKVVRGRLKPVDPDHRIMRGIDMAPGLDYPEEEFQVYDVSPITPEIAYIQDSVTGDIYPGIVENKALISGKVIFLNFEPGKLPGVFYKVLEYMR